MCAVTYVYAIAHHALRRLFACWRSFSSVTANYCHGHCVSYVEGVFVCSGAVGRRAKVNKAESSRTPQDKTWLTFQTVSFSGHPVAQFLAMLRQSKHFLAWGSNGQHGRWRV